MHESTEISKLPKIKAPSRRGAGRPRTVSDEERSEFLTVRVTPDLLKILNATSKRWNIPVSTLVFNMLDYAVSKRSITPHEISAYSRGASVRANFFVFGETSNEDRSAS